MRTADRQHLLLTAAQSPGGLAEPLPQPRKQVDDLGAAGPSSLARGEGTQVEVLCHRQIREHTPSLEGLADSGCHDPIRRAADDGCPRETNVAMCDLSAMKGQKAADRAEDARLAGTVRAQQGDRTSLDHIERDVVRCEHRAAIPDGHTLHFEKAHRVACPALGAVERPEQDLARMQRRVILRDPGSAVMAIPFV